MKAHNLKHTKQAKSTARVKRSIRRHLSWLTGYPKPQPGSLVWVCPLASGSEPRTLVSLQHIGKAEGVIHELYRDYRLALPVVVGQHEIWVSRSKAYLAYAKRRLQDKNQSIHNLFEQDASYQQTYKKQLKQLDPALKPIVDALSWMHFVDRTPLKKSFEVLLKHQTDFAALSGQYLDTALRLCALYEWDGAKAQYVIDLLLKPHALQVTPDGGSAYAKPFADYKISVKKHKPLVLPAKPDAPLYPELVDFLQALMQPHCAQRRRVLALFNRIQLRAGAQAWMAWWADAERLIRQITHLIQALNNAYFEQGYDGGKADYFLTDRFQTVGQKQGELQGLMKRCPPALPLSTVLSAIGCLSESAALTKSLVKVLSHLPSDAQPCAFILHFDHCYRRQNNNAKGMTHYLAAFDGYLKGGTEPPCLLLWQGVYEAYYYHTPESKILGQLSAEALVRFFQLLADINQYTERSVEYADMMSLVFIIEAKFSRERALDLVAYLMHHSMLNSVSETILRVACILGENNENISKLIKIWHKLEEEYTDEDTLLVCFELYAQPDGLHEQALFREILYSGQVKALVHSGYKIRVIQKIGCPDAVPAVPKVGAQAAPWMADYPDIFQPTLMQLNAMSPNAEKKVKKLFAANWWTQGMLQDEICALQTRLQQTLAPTLQKRLSNLQTRLQKHQPMSAVMQQKIGQKMAKQVSHERFLQWQQTLENVFIQAWCQFFQLSVSDAPAWLLEPHTLSQLLPIIDFNQRSRNVAKQVIQRRCLPAPWDFREAPENQQFLQHISTLGLNQAVWLEGIGDKHYATETCGLITLTVATDPLAMMNMGGHFKTCLSPGNFNFFSVFANIADINKRVLYGKNKAGDIIGRVLIGLTQAGGIKVFNLYFHHAETHFSRFALAYIKTWADELGAVLTSSGDLPTLVADEWYDDGAIDLDNGIECFKPKSAFRQVLKTLAPSLFEATFRAALAPLSINELTLPLLLTLSELKDNTSLIRIIIDLATRVPGLNQDNKIVLYQLSHQCGEAKYCYKIFRVSILKALVHSAIESDYFDFITLQFMLQHHPADVLTVMKKIDRKSHGSLSKHCQKMRLKALAVLNR